MGNCWIFGLLYDYITGSMILNRIRWSSATGYIAKANDTCDHPAYIVRETIFDA